MPNHELHTTNQRDKNTRRLPHMICPNKVLVKQGCNVDVIAEKLETSPGAIFQKMKRLGLEVVVTRLPVTTTSCSISD
ncbi:MAG TPA: hypothetical protein VMT26_01645 [Candidatus Bathyarchaeia archaeon]|nr:hypothetical protein [Candidatus Bathyarchaeia archaeon]